MLKLLASKYNVDPPETEIVSDPTLLRAALTAMGEAGALAKLTVNVPLLPSLIVKFVVEIMMLFEDIL